MENTIFSYPILIHGIHNANPGETPSMAIKRLQEYADKNKVNVILNHNDRKVMIHYKQTVNDLLKDMK